MKECKWSFEQLKSYLATINVNFETIWKEIKSVITLSLLNFMTTIPNTPSSFELFGFDIMIDSNLKPWLIEINAPPALSLYDSIDELIKP